MEIAVQIKFLVSPQLSDPSSPKYGEWPPAPDRILQALVATAAETGKDMEVLRHLESAPSIHFSRAVTPEAPRRYVPDNYRRTNRYHQGAARYLPTVHPESPTVSYVWKEIPSTVVEPLRQIVEAVTHIGRAASLVTGSLIEPHLVKPNWVPDDQGELLLRVPYVGRLRNLQQAFQAGMRSSTAPVGGYREVEKIYPSTEWGDLMVLRPQRQLDISNTPKWTDRIRRAVMSKAEATDMPSLIHGHGDHRHVAWAALPDVGHKYASGNIIGLGCWLPSDCSNEERGLLGSLFMRLTEVAGISLQIDPVGLKGLQRSTWSRASRVFATVTPIALDRWPKRNKPAEKVVADSLKSMGLPEPLRVVCSNHSPVKGAANARKYPSRRGNRYISHTLIEWDEPIKGPLLIGADRYYGSGLCRPLAERR